MAEERVSVSEKHYDPLIPYGMQGVHSRLAEHRRVCPLFGTKDGYKPANKVCNRCHLSMVCLYLQDALHTGDKILEVKAQLNVEHFYDESTFHLEAKAYVNKLAETVAGKIRQGEAMTLARVLVAVQRDVVGIMKNHDPNAVEIVLFALSHHELLKVEGDRYGLRR
jgi:hypothetical protein